MTKELVSSTLASLVEEQNLSWETPVHQVLPSFAPRSDLLREHATLLDLLSMPSGLERYNIWSGSYNRVSMIKSQSLKVFINNLESSSDLRSIFEYDNWAYEIAGHVCEAVGKEIWDSMLHIRIFDPLGMKQTDAKGERQGYDNVAKAYMVLDDQSPVPIPGSQLYNATPIGPAGGVQSCIDDLLILYRSVLKVCVSQFSPNKTSTGGNPFHQLKHTISAHVQLPGLSLYESSYGVGWMRTQLPNVMCKISANHGLLGTEPVLGEGAESRIIVPHEGSMTGAYSGVVLSSTSKSAIVVLSNRTLLCDLADWTMQLLTKTLFDFPNKIDIAQ